MTCSTFSPSLHREQTLLPSLSVLLFQFQWTILNYQVPYDLPSEAKSHTLHHLYIQMIPKYWKSLNKILQINTYTTTHEKNYQKIANKYYLFWMKAHHYSRNNFVHYLFQNFFFLKIIFIKIFLFFNFFLLTTRKIVVLK